MDEVFINKHPLVQHKATRLRDKTTGTSGFRNLVEEIGISMGYGALADLTAEDIEVKTPLERTLSPVITGQKMAVVPILRAGFGMVNGIQALVPTAKMGHIDLYRNPDTHEPVGYYCRLPTSIGERTVMITDPMLVTSGPACDAICMIKQHGGEKIKFMCITAVPEGLKHLQKEHPDIQIYAGYLNRQLDEHVYVLPDLGGAGDRVPDMK